MHRLLHFEYVGLVVGGSKWAGVRATRVTHGADGVHVSLQVCARRRVGQTPRSGDETTYTYKPSDARCARAHSRPPTTAKFYSTPDARRAAAPPRPSGDLLPGAEVVQAVAGK